MTKLTMQQFAQRRWEKRRKSARRFSRVVKTRIVIGVIFSPILTMFVVFQEKLTAISISVLVASLAVFVAAVAMMRNRYATSYTKSVGDGASRVLARDALPALTGMLDALSEKMQIGKDKIEVVLQGRRYDTSPSVYADEEVARLYLPLGFVKLLRSAPNQAEAILAHELSHVVQKDTYLWLLAESWLFAAKKLLLPVNIIVAIVVIALQFYAVQTIPYGYEVDGNAFAVEIVRALIPVAVILAFSYSIRQLRRRSENIADLGACAFASKQGLIDALSSHTNSAGGGWLFSTHESTADRIRFIEKALVQ